jgi:uridylate kinase
MTSEVQQSPAFRRVLLKISGEALIGEQTFGIDINVARMVAQEIKQVHDLESRLLSLSAAATFFVASRKAPAAWTARPLITSACWRPS